MQFLSAAMATLAIVLMVTAAGTASATETSPSPMEQLEQAADRLVLTDEQRDAFAEILATRIAKQREIMTEFGLDPDDPAEGMRSLGRRDRKRLRDALGAAKRDSTEALQSVLTAAQLREYEHMMAEAEAARRAQIKARMLER